MWGKKSVAAQQINCSYSVVTQAAELKVLPLGFTCAGGDNSPQSPSSSTSSKNDFTKLREALFFLTFSSLVKCSEIHSFLKLLEENR